MRVLPAALAAVLVLGLSACDTKDDPENRAGPPADDLAPNGGEICPRVLPTAADDEAGFGTEEPATGRPDPGDFTRAWVCVYDLDQSRRDDAWVRSQREVPLTEADLVVLHDAVEALRPARRDQICPANLGPRYLLVTLRGGTDLTGYAVDAFGCLDVRVTDDPATNPVGEARQPGTVSGVLSGGRPLLDVVGRYVELPG